MSDASCAITRRLPKWHLAVLLAALGLSGCGTMRERTATHQLLLSDAVDRAVAHLDFSPLAGQSVFLDTQYMPSIKDNTGINTPYIVSSLRQQMLSAGCLLKEKADDADYIVEARVGALGMDGHDVNYGVPQNNLLSAAAVAIPGSGALPPLPEISLARKTEDSAAAKIALFAYRRETREPAWQFGTSIARSKAQGRWILGVGPLQSGAIYGGPMFAGERLKLTEDAETRRQAEVKQEELYRSARNLQRGGGRTDQLTEGDTGSPRVSRLPADNQPGHE